MLAVKSDNLGVPVDIYTSDYNQYAQAMIDKRSQLFKFKPDLCFLIVDNRAVLKDMLFLPYAIKDSERKGFIKQALKETFNYIESFQKNCDGKLIVFNLALPNYSPLGILEEKTDFSLKQAVEFFNKELRVELT